MVSGFPPLNVVDGEALVILYNVHNSCTDLLSSVHAVEIRHAHALKDGVKKIIEDMSSEKVKVFLYYYSESSKEEKFKPNFL